MPKHYDLAVVGAGIAGLAHAYAAARLGKHVVVIDREARATGASIRNFGFVTITGQERGVQWRRARRSAQLWRRIAPEAGIPILHRGLLMVARREEAKAVCEAFLATEMGEGLRWLTSAELQRRAPQVTAAGARALYSPHEARVESRTAIPALAAYLTERHGVDFIRETVVHAVAPPRLETSRGVIEAEAAVVCPGDDFNTLFADRLAGRGLKRSLLHMLRLAPPLSWPGCAVMSDLGLVRYAGYAALAEAAALRARLEQEQPKQLEFGVHLIAVQSGDGSLVVGDSHVYGAAPEPFAPIAIDDLILDEYAAVLGAPPPVIERWTGTYAVSPAGPVLVEKIGDAARLVIITSGTGASISFALAEEVIGGLYGVSDWSGV